MMRRAGRRPLRAHSRSYPITPYFTIKYTQFQVNRREIHKSFSFFIKEKPANCQIGGAPAVKLQKKKVQSRTNRRPKDARPRSREAGRMRAESAARREIQAALPTAEPLLRAPWPSPHRGSLGVRASKASPPRMRINSRNRKKMTKGARREIVRCEQTDRTLLRDLPSQ